MAEAYVTQALIEIELVALRRQYQQHINDANATLGAIQFGEHLIATMSGSTIIPADPGAKPGSDSESA